ncbi:hypothetical protein POVWA2_031000 [Plasmodium ovale wallikeri]|uniref:Uncharacterized protein n=1 Tax=Plasmodium ovale wallikeri TaxID=864142 RepID=A0A1A8YWW8_PLAOA|nr:hypothetical protein POVWA1_031270 [Plasmodium ovale wallikeri]SBT36601.1 hypothetical protein POVWA2_031000 [Plasmodium ovale wallikeri]
MCDHYYVHQVNRHHRKLRFCCVTFYDNDKVTLQRVTVGVYEIWMSLFFASHFASVRQFAGLWGIRARVLICFRILYRKISHILFLPLHVGLGHKTNLPSAPYS